MTQWLVGLARMIGENARKSEWALQQSGLTERNLSGTRTLDTGCHDYVAGARPKATQAICVKRNGAFFRVLKSVSSHVNAIQHQSHDRKRMTSNFVNSMTGPRPCQPVSVLQKIMASPLPRSFAQRRYVSGEAALALGEKIGSRPEGQSEWTARFAASAPKTTEDAPAHSPGLPSTHTFPFSPWPLKLYSFGTAGLSCARILVLQLGHLGDFIISLPALRQLRAAFPHSHITLVTGAWNRSQAEACGLVDKVESFDFFPEVARNWDGRVAEELDTFRLAAKGFFDLAIDLRVDLDTRHLLQLVDAGIRAGIGPSSRFPFLDVALPYDYAQRVRTQSAEEVNAVLGPHRFHSRMPQQGDFRHETDFTVTDTHVIYGPYLCLQEGDYRATFDMSFRGSGFGRRPAKITLEIAQGDAGVLAVRVLDGGMIRRGGKGRLGLAFTVRDEATPCEFRVHVAGRPFRAVLGFGGVKLERAGAPPAARVKPAELHVGELMSLLVQLTASRVASPPAYPAAGSSTDEQDRVSRAGNSLPVIVIAPASNSDLRDWPADHYATLVGMLVKRYECTVVLLGSREQAGVTAYVARESQAGNKVTDLAGRTAWADIPAILQSADLVICNNSGIGHLAAAQGVRTLAIYSASHQPQEWGPRGPMAHAVMAVVPCSPCGLDRLSECGNGHTCMQDLAPVAVLDLADRLLRLPVPAAGMH